MNLTLKRTEWRRDGIFGELRDPGGNVIAHTLEHSFMVYATGSYSYHPKVAPGTYTCVRGLHNTEGRVKKGMPPFETFMVQDVPDFCGQKVTGILFHVGNFDSDSEGCILLGAAEIERGTVKMIAHSQSTFERFLAFQQGLNAFTLWVS
jgi:hypothetical protein